MKSPFDKIPWPLRPIAVWIGQRRLRTSHVAVAVTILMILGIISTAVFNFGVGVRPGPATGDYPEADEPVTILTVTFWFVPAVLGIFYALLANKLHTWLQRHARSRLNKPSEFFKNHDLTKAFGHAIEMILLDAADPVDADTLPRPLNPDTTKWLRTNATNAVAAWMDALSEDYKQDSSEWKRVWESEAFTWLEDREKPALKDELWYTFLTRMNGWLTLPFAERSEDATAIITRLNVRFGEAYWEVIKNDAAGDGYAAKALDLVVQAELLRRTSEMAATTDQMQKSLEAIKAEWEKHSAAVMKTLKEHGVKLNVVLRISLNLEASLEKVQSTLDRLLDISQGTNTIVKGTDAKMTQGFSQVNQRLDGLAPLARADQLERYHQAVLAAKPMLTPEHSTWSPETKSPIIVGCFEYPPLSHSGESGFSLDSVPSEGPWIELISQVAARLGWNCKYDFFSAQHLAGNGWSAFDIVVGLFNTSPRRERFDFSIPIHRIALQGICRSDLPQFTKADLLGGGLRVIVQPGEFGWEYARAELSASGLDRMISEIATPTTYQCLEMLLAGTCDIAIVDEVSCQHFLNAVPDSTQFRWAFSKTLQTADACIAFRKPHTVDIAVVNECVREVRNTSEFRQQEREALAGFDIEPCSLDRQT